MLSKMVRIIKNRVKLNVNSEDMCRELANISDEGTAEEVRLASLVSMGVDISSEDEAQMQALAEAVTSLEE